MSDSKELKIYQIVVTLVTSNHHIDVDMITPLWSLLDESKGEYLRSISLPKELPNCL